MTAPTAGLPAEPSILVVVDQLVAAYHDRAPDVAVPAERVAFGTSGHRGSSLTGSFNEAHIVATTQAICDHRRAAGVDGPLFIGRDTHALSEPAFRTAIEVLIAVDIACDVRAAYCGEIEGACVKFLEFTQFLFAASRALDSVHPPTCATPAPNSSARFFPTSARQ